MKTSNIFCVILIIAGALLLATSLPLPSGATMAQSSIPWIGGACMGVGVIIAAFNFKK